MNEEKKQQGGQPEYPEQRQTMTMQEAVARSKGDDLGVLHSLSAGDQGEFGALFEYSKG